MSLARSTIPSRRLIGAAAAWSLAGLACHLADFHASLWVQLSAPLGLWALLDAVAGRRGRAPGLRRLMPPVWTQGRAGTVELVLDHPGGRPLDVEVHEHHPSGWEAPTAPARLRLEPGSDASVRLELRPRERGDARFAPAELLLATPSGFWQTRMRAGVGEEVRVLPDLTRVLGAEISGQAALAPRGGVHRNRRRGEGTEFHQLREYRQGDSLRSIDWKATARQGRPISREYQEERDQQVVVLLDAGRRMGRRDDDRSHFDHCLEAVLRLSWIASRQGDAVGLLCFSDTTRRWLPPARGRVGLDRILEGAYDLQPDDAPPDFLLAAEELRARVRRRALVVLVTSLEEEDASTLGQALSLIGNRHLVLCASLLENALERALESPPGDFPAARTQAAVTLLLSERREAIRRLGLTRGLLLETTPRRLHGDLADRYLAIKRSRRL